MVHCNNIRNFHTSNVAIGHSNFSAIMQISKLLCNSLLYKAWVECELHILCDENHV